MKGLSWSVTPKSRRPDFFFFMFRTPYLSTRSLRLRSHSSPSSPGSNLLLYSFLMAAVFFLVRFFLLPIHYSDRLILGFGIYFFTQSLGALGQSLFSRGEFTVSPIHSSPLTSGSLSEFWGRRWNLWVQDWLSDLGRPFHRSHKRKILASFLFSGIFHEAMVNLPHWVLTGENHFGTMLLYFAIQGTGLYSEKKFLRHSPPVIRRVFCWSVVILPSPLFINFPVLRFFGVTE